MSDDKFSIDSLDRSYHSRHPSGIRSSTPGHNIHLYQQEIKELRETVKFIEYHLAMTNKQLTQYHADFHQANAEIEHLKECLKKEIDLRLDITNQNSEIRKEMQFSADRQNQVNEHHTAQILLYEQKLCSGGDQMRVLNEKNILSIEEIQNLKLKNGDLAKERDRLIQDMNSLIYSNEKLNIEIKQLKVHEKIIQKQEKKIKLIENELRKANSDNEKLWQIVKNTSNPVLQFSRMNLADTKNSRRSSVSTPKSEDRKPAVQELNIKKLIKDVITELDTPTKFQQETRKNSQKSKPSKSKITTYRRNGSKTLDSTKAESHEEHRIVEKVINESVYAQKQFSDLMEDYFRNASEMYSRSSNDYSHVLYSANKLFVDFTSSVISYFTSRNI